MNAYHFADCDLVGDSLFMVLLYIDPYIIKQK